jgi:ATP-dependent DNA helicase RecG
MSDEEKKSALADMSSGAASILVATTVVEVGITIPRLRRCIVVHPDRHGLTTLHQLRGRLARHGGEGWFDLYLPNKVKDETMARLQVLVETTDGFAVAEHDMRLRGVGDMSRDSNRQSGADETFLFGRPVSIDALDEVMGMMSVNTTGKQKEANGPNQ